MKYQPPSEGLHQEFHPNAVLREEYTIKNGRRHGPVRKWHENGQLADECVYVEGLADGDWRHWNKRGKLLGVDRFKAGTGIARLWHENDQLSAEFSYFQGEMTGRMRYWDHDGMLFGTKFFFQCRPISRKKYQELCDADPSLPRFVEEKATNTFGNYIRKLRKEKREQAKLGPTSAQLEQLQLYDKDCKAETKGAGSKEALAWLRKKTRGEKELGEMTKGEALVLVRRLYALGAVKIWATGIERDGDGSEYSKRLVIALPVEQAKVGEVYAACTDAARPFISLGEYVPAIVPGQKYMAVSLM